MEWSDLFGYLLAALWLLGPLLRRRQQKQGQQQQPQRPGAPEAPRVSPTQLAQRGLNELERLEAEATRLRAGLDPETAGRLGPWVDETLLPRLSARRGRLQELAQGGGLAAVLAELSDLESSLAGERADVAALRLIAVRRAEPELRATHAAADRLAREVYEPLRTFADHGSIPLAIGAPIPVVWLARDDQALFRSSLGARVLPVPGAVRLQPWLWPSLGPSFGRYLQAAVPDLRPELHRALALDARDEPLIPGSPALSRVFFGAWSETLVADFAGASLFGPVYLRMLARELAHDDFQAVTAIGLAPDGTLSPAPPPHVRVRLTGRWLAQMALESTAAEILREWQTAHGDPALFHFGGRGGLAPIPAEPVLAHLEALTDQADLHAFRSLAGNDLGDVPGFQGWNGVSGLAAQASRSLAEGHPKPGPARALLAAAALAAFERPAAAGLIDRALHASIAGESPRRRRRPDQARPGAAAPGPRARARSLDARRLTEALLIGDLLLESRAPRLPRWRARPRPAVAG